VRHSFLPGVIGVAMLAAVTCLSSCAAGKAPDITPAPVTGVPMGTGGGTRGFGLEMTKRIDGVEATFAAPPATVFTALGSVFASLELPLTLRDSVTGTIGNEGFKFRRTFANIQSRRLLDCGGTSGMPNAETYTIRMSVLSNVNDVGNGTTRLITVVQASAENPSYPGSGVNCASSGALEDRIAADLRARLNNRQPPLLH